MMHALFQPFPMSAGRSAQVWHHHPSFRRPAHFHEEPELNVVTAGVGTLAVGNERWSLRAGDAIYLQPGQDHELLSESPDFELFVLALEPELAARCVPTTARRSSVVALDPRTLDTLREEWLAVAHLTDRGRVESLLCEQFGSLASRFDTAPPLCRRTLNTLQLSPEVTEEEIAAQLGVHASEVSRTVRAHFGMRLVDYRARLRLMTFVQCVDSGQSLTRAAFSSGFGSYAQLHRVFRRHAACSPAEYFGGQRERVNARLHRESAADASPCASGAVRSQVR